MENFLLYLKIEFKNLNFILMKLHTEITDLILLHIHDFHLAIKLNNKYVINKLYDSNIHTWYYASHFGYLELRYY